MRAGGAAAASASAAQPSDGPGRPVAQRTSPRRSARRSEAKASTSLAGDLLVVAEGLHDRPPGGLLRGVAEDRPVRHLAGGGAARAERPEQAARPARRQGVEAGRPGGLVGGAAAVRLGGPVAQAVKQQDDDRAHGSRGGRR